MTDMFSRFTDRARKVMALSRLEAQRFNHEFVGPEHILLGLLKEGSGTASAAMKSLDVDSRKVRLEVEKLITSGPDMVTAGKLPRTPAATQAIEFALQERESLGHNYVGTEHLLLGLLRLTDGITSSVFSSVSLKYEEVKEEIIVLLAPPPDDGSKKWAETTALLKSLAPLASSGYFMDLMERIGRSLERIAAALEARK